MIRRTVMLGLLAAVLTASAGSPAGAAVRAGHSGWLWSNPLPQGHTLRALELEGLVGYAAGDFGTLLGTDDGGATWSGRSTGLTAGLSQVAVIDADSVVVAGRCAVRRSDDGGTTFARLAWTASDEACPAPIVTLAFPSDRRGYLVLADGTVLRSDDGGATWAATAPGPAPDPSAAAFSGPDAGVVTTATGLVYRTADAGVSWTLVHVSSRGLRGVSFSDAAGGFAVGEGSLVLRTLDGGRTWTERGGELPVTLTSIACASASICLATTDTADRVLRTTDGGRTFTPVASAGDLLAVAFGTGTRAVGVGVLGATAASGDLGASWAPVGARLPASLIRLRAASPLVAWATGRTGRIARTLDGGATWQTLVVGTRRDVTDVSFAGPDVGYALDLGGRVFRTTDAGASWTRVRTGFQARPQAVLATGSSAVLLIGPLGILRSSNGGRTFVRVRSKAARRAKIFEIDRARGALVAFGSRRVAISTNRGRTWRSVRRPPRALVAGVDFLTRRTGYLLEQDGRLWRTRDRGRHWRDLPGIGSDDAIGLTFSSARSGYLVLSRFGADARGYVLRTSDGGRTWRPQLLTDVPLAAAGVVAEGATDLALALDGSLFTTSSGGDAGAVSTVTLSTPRRTLRGPHRIRVSGTVAGAAAGTDVVVGRRFRGESGWDHRRVRTGHDGGFTTSWKTGRTATFAAQWLGDDDQAGDGSRPLRVRVLRAGR
jgi:photosystem II stability/assembly factor-like uncharacterized protein